MDLFKEGSVCESMASDGVDEKSGGRESSGGGGGMEEGECVRDNREWLRWRRQRDRRAEAVVNLGLWAVAIFGINCFLVKPSLSFRHYSLPSKLLTGLYRYRYMEIQGLNYVGAEWSGGD